MPGQEAAFGSMAAARGGGVRFRSRCRVIWWCSERRAPRLYRTRVQSGTPVRLAGPPGNRDGIGAGVRLLNLERQGPLRELHAGSGYWSATARPGDVLRGRANPDRGALARRQTVHGRPAVRRERNRRAMEELWKWFGSSLTGRLIFGGVSLGTLHKRSNSAIPPPRGQAAKGGPTSPSVVPRIRAGGGFGWGRRFWCPLSPGSPGVRLCDCRVRALRILLVRHRATGPTCGSRTSVFRGRFFPRTLARHPNPALLSPVKPAGVCRVLVLANPPPRAILRRPLASPASCRSCCRSGTPGLDSKS